jgi:hypothetical protein
VNYISIDHARFKPGYASYIFITCDFISLILQAVGGAMSSTSNGSSTAGVDIALAGLGFQVVTLVVFSALVIDYGIRSRYIWNTIGITKRFVILVIACDSATILILMRCCYRVYELNQGYQQTSAALRDQPLFIGFEAVSVSAPYEL